MKNIFEQDEIVDPLSEVDIEEVEKKSGKKLPKSFIELLKIQNGGRIKNLCFKTSTNISLRFKNEISVFEISGLGRKDGQYGTLERSNYYINEWELPADILLLFGEGHWWVFLDYRNIELQKMEPKVSLIDLEFGTDLILAQNFGEFVDRLEEATNYGNIFDDDLNDFKIEDQ